MKGAPMRIEPHSSKIDYKLMYEEEARKFQQETRRTSELSVMIDRGLEVLRAQGHASEPWPKACTICDWMREAKALRERPINL